MAFLDWEAAVLPLNYARKIRYLGCTQKIVWLFLARSYVLMRWQLEQTASHFSISAFGQLLSVILTYLARSD